MCINTATLQSLLLKFTSDNFEQYQKLLFCVKNTKKYLKRYTTVFLR